MDHGCPCISWREIQGPCYPNGNIGGEPFPWKDVTCTPPGRRRRDGFLGRHPFTGLPHPSSTRPQKTMSDAHIMRQCALPGLQYVQNPPQIKKNTPMHSHLLSSQNTSAAPAPVWSPADPTPGPSPPSAFTAVSHSSNASSTSIGAPVRIFYQRNWIHKYLGSPVTAAELKTRLPPQRTVSEQLNEGLRG